MVFFTCYAILKLLMCICLSLFQWKIKRILGECLLMSSLPGKTLRMLLDISRLAEPGILFISIPTDSLFKLAIMAI